MQRRRCCRSRSRRRGRPARSSRTKATAERRSPSSWRPRSWSEETLSMAEVLVLVDSADGAVKKSTLELLTAARTIGEPSAVVIGAPGVAAGLNATLAEYGVAKVYVAESDEVDGYLVAPKAEVLASIV